MENKEPCGKEFAASAEVNCLDLKKTAASAPFFTSKEGQHNPVTSGDFIDIQQIPIKGIYYKTIFMAYQARYCAYHLEVCIYLFVQDN